MGAMVNPPVAANPPANPPSPPTPPPPTNSPIRLLLTVASLGAVGGLAAATYTRAGSASVFAKFPLYGDIFAEMLLGAVAAVIADFALVEDPKVTIKTFARALLFGFVWNPVLSGVQANAAAHSSKQIAQSALSAGSQLTSLADKTSPVPSSQVEGAANALAQPLSQLNQIGQPQDKSAVITAATEAINKVSSAPNVNPAVKVDALQKIGTASAKSSPELSLRVIAALKSLGQSNPAVQQNATAAILNIQSTSNVVDTLSHSFEAKH